jgi:hypothetical protein
MTPGTPAPAGAGHCPRRRRRHTFRHPGRRAVACRRTALPVRMPVPVSPARRRAPRRRALVATLLACLLPACNDLGPDPAHVRLRYLEVAPLDRDRLVATLDVPGHQWYFEGTDLQPEGDGWLAGREITVGSDGDLLLRLALRGTGDDAVAQADVSIALTHGARWRIDVFPSSLESAEACGGCNGVHRVPIALAARPSARDWLYVTWTALPTGAPGG